MNFQSNNGQVKYNKIMFIIYGQEKYFINKYITNIIKANEYAQVHNFYWNEITDLNNIVETIASHSLFGEQRIICIYDCPYLETKISKNEQNSAQDLLNQILINDQDIIVFINNLVSKDKIYTNFFTNSLNSLSPTLLFANTLNGFELNQEIQQIAMQSGAHIDNLAINALNRKLPNNLYLIQHEITKLAHLNSKITADLVENNVSNVYVEDTFGFSNSLETNSFDIIWRKYKEKINEAIEITSLISQLSQQLILADQIFLFMCAKYTIDDVANSLKLNPYRVKKVYSLLNILGIKKVQALILALAELDQEIKEGKTDEVLGFENILIRFFN
ncbi:DNA polymerase III delta subunit [Mycoplasmopsis californica]|nr:DNA polymerase III delta subunit [Mycoplasmopsis californica]BBG41552.1 DNA polymerase III delta subunit [Mycoplasmopsis californica]BBG42145.1 DNA polymerase III delta subunit [Mycoplasmopsis californica]